MIEVKPRRVILADVWRGLVILLMVVYHALYDLTVLFAVPVPYFWSLGGRLLQRFICISFILISGMCCSFSRSNLRRGAVVFGCGMLMTVATLAVMPQVPILFGVLHLLGASMMLYPLVHKLLRRIPPMIGLAGGLLLFLLFMDFPSGYVGIGPLSAELPAELYSTQWLFWLGLQGPGFFSSDYFPLIPWSILFFTGSFLGELARQDRLPKGCYRERIPLLGKIGHYSLWIYLIHQPILYGVLWLIFGRG